MPRAPLFGHQRAMKSERILLLALAVMLGVGCLLILLPFLPAMIWAAILVYCAWPLYQRCIPYVRPGVAALVITVTIVGNDRFLE